MDILTTASDWILGFFIFLWRSPAFTDAPAWAQAIALLITGVVAVHAAEKAYRGANNQANATRDQVRVAIALQQETVNREAEQYALETKNIAAALAAEVMVIVVEINEIRRNIKNRETMNVMELLASSPTTFPVYDSNPVNVARLGVAAATAVVATYNDFRTQVRYWRDREESGDPQETFDAYLAMTSNFDSSFRDAVLTLRQLHEVAGIGKNNPFEKWFKDENLCHEFDTLALDED